MKTKYAIAALLISGVLLTSCKRTLPSTEATTSSTTAQTTTGVQPTSSNSTSPNTTGTPSQTLPSSKPTTPSVSQTTTSTQPTTPSTDTTPKEIPVESISISASKTVLGVTQRVKVKVSILPENATNKTYTLTSSDKAFVSIEGDELVANRVTNDQKITITATSSNGKVGTLKVSVAPLSDVAFEELNAKLDKP